MLSLFFIRSYQWTFYSNHLFVVTTTKENAEKRVGLLAKTWFKRVPEVHIYTDDIDFELVSKLTKENPRCNMTFHRIPDSAPFLEGTGIDSPLARSRIRNLYVLKDIYEKYTEKKWFLIMEDQTYFVPSKYSYFFNWKNSSVPEIWGHSSYFFDENYRFLDRKQRMFYDLHGGIAISNEMLRLMQDHIKTVSNVYASPLIEEEVKISLLANLSYSKFYDEVPYHMSWIMCERELEEMQRQRGHVGTDVVSFAYSADKMLTLYGGNVVEWVDKQGKPKQAGFDKYVAQRLTMEYPETGSFIKLTFGYSIEALEARYYAKSPLKPHFDDMDENIPTYYTQEFDGFNVTYECDDSLEDGELATSGDHEFNSESLLVSIKCASPSESVFYQENQQPRLLNVSVNWL